MHADLQWRASKKSIEIVKIIINAFMDRSLIFAKKIKRYIDVQAMLSVKRNYFCLEIKSAKLVESLCKIPLMAKTPENARSLLKNSFRADLCVLCSGISRII